MTTNLIISSLFMCLLLVLSSCFSPLEKDHLKDSRNDNVVTDRCPHVPKVIKEYSKGYSFAELQAIGIQIIEAARLDVSRVSDLPGNRKIDLNQLTSELAKLYNENIRQKAFVSNLFWEQDLTFRQTMCLLIYMSERDDLTSEQKTHFLNLIKELTLLRNKYIFLKKDYGPKKPSVIIDSITDTRITFTLFNHNDETLNVYRIYFLHPTAEMYDPEGQTGNAYHGVNSDDKNSGSFIPLEDFGDVLIDLERNETAIYVESLSRIQIPPKSSKPYILKYSLLQSSDKYREDRIARSRKKNINYYSKSFIDRDQSKIFEVWNNVRNNMIFSVEFIWPYTEKKYLTIYKPLYNTTDNKFNYRINEIFNKTEQNLSD